jgi:hypothetical protein
MPSRDVASFGRVNIGSAQAMARRAAAKAFVHGPRD